MAARPGPGNHAPMLPTSDGQERCAQNHPIQGEEIQSIVNWNWPGTAMAIGRCVFACAWRWWRFSRVGCEMPAG